LYASQATECLEEEAMSVARVTEITSSSNKSFQDAIEVGIARAAKTLKNVEGAWIQDQKVVVEDGKISAYRVNMKVTFILAE
jgi:flavin-binding protein dodecin